MNKTPTFEKMVELHNRGLVSMKKQEQNGQEFYIFKYRNKVFYKNLWNEDDALLDSRGVVFTEAGKLAQLPLKKVFNLNENGTRIDPNKKVYGSRKANGFMLAVSYFDGDLLFSSTGSLTSEFVELGKKVFLDQCKRPLSIINDNCTYIFEVCHKSDPHIVEEEEGVYLLGIRDKVTGGMVSPTLVRKVARLLGAHTVDTNVLSAGYFIEELTYVEHEGFMLYDYETHEPIVKLKSPHYLSKKAIMRLGKGKVDDMFINPDKFKKRIDEEFFNLVDAILSEYEKDEWRDMDEQSRRIAIERFFETGSF